MVQQLALRREVVDELEEHLRSEVENLTGSGLPVSYTLVFSLVLLQAAIGLTALVPAGSMQAKRL